MRCKIRNQCIDTQQAHKLTITVMASSELQYAPSFEWFKTTPRRSRINPIKASSPQLVTAPRSSGPCPGFNVARRTGNLARTEIVARVLGCVSVVQRSSSLTSSRGGRGGKHAGVFLRLVSGPFELLDGAFRFAAALSAVDSAVRSGAATAPESGSSTSTSFTNPVMSLNWSNLVVVPSGVVVP